MRHRVVALYPPPSRRCLLPVGDAVCAGRPLGAIVFVVLLTQPTATSAAKSQDRPVSLSAADATKDFRSDDKTLVQEGSTDSGKNKLLPGIALLRTLVILVVSAVYILCKRRLPRPRPRNLPVERLCRGIENQAAAAASASASASLRAAADRQANFSKTNEMPKPASLQLQVRRRPRHEQAPPPATSLSPRGGRGSGRCFLCVGSR